MSELDTVELTNPTTEDFTWNYNGEPYTIAAKEKKHFAKYVGLHLAKHLSTQIIQREALEKTTQAERDRALLQPNERFNLRLAQLAVYDTPERRIALYKMFQRKDLVQELITLYPFKGFIGDMNIYDEYVRTEEEIAVATKEGKTFEEMVEARKIARESAKAKVVAPASV